MASKKPLPSDGLGWDAQKHCKMTQQRLLQSGEGNCHLSFQLRFFGWLLEELECYFRCVIVCQITCAS